MYIYNLLICSKSLHVHVYALQIILNGCQSRQLYILYILMHVDSLYFVYRESLLMEQLWSKMAGKVIDIFIEASQEKSSG